MSKILDLNSSLLLIQGERKGSQLFSLSQLAFKGPSTGDRNASQVMDVEWEEMILLCLKTAS